MENKLQSVHLFKVGHIESNRIEALGEEELQLGTQPLLLQPDHMASRQRHQDQA